MEGLIARGCVFRGHERAHWSLQTSIEREFTTGRSDVERKVLERFIRLAPPLLPGYLLSTNPGTAGWLGLIQHHGGPTRLLDVTRSPYVALFFAFEAVGNKDRALWAIDSEWCRTACAMQMVRTAKTGKIDLLAEASRLVTDRQDLVVHSVVYPTASDEVRPFTGVFPLDPWKPDPRQSAQQAMFLCMGNVALSFAENIAAQSSPRRKGLYRVVLPARLREEVVEQLSRMNVTAATLFPDLDGLARSLRTLPVRRARSAAALPALTFKALRAELSEGKPRGKRAKRPRGGSRTR
jgi:hypothetical protein